MTDEFGPGVLEQEKNLIAVLRDPSATYDALRTHLDALPPGARLVSRDALLNIAGNDRLECWRRLTALTIVIDGCISYPCELEDFSLNVLARLGADQQRFVDMSIAQHLPFDRHQNEKIYMAPLAIDTSIGKAGLYFAVLQARPAVMRAAVHPTADSC